MFFLIITHYLPIPDNINSLHPHCLCYLNHSLPHLSQQDYFSCSGGKNENCLFITMKDKYWESIECPYCTVCTILNNPISWSKIDKV